MADEDKLGGEIKKKGRGGRRPGAGRPKGSKNVKHRVKPAKSKAYACSLGWEDALNFEYVASATGMTPYKLLKTVALAVASQGAEEVDEFKAAWNEERDGRIHTAQFLVTVELMLTTENMPTRDELIKKISPLPDGYPIQECLDEGIETEFVLAGPDVDLEEKGRQEAEAQWNEAVKKFKCNSIV